MAEDKKYYYLKLKDNFFDSDTMIILEVMPDGYLYSNILLKLYLRSLKFKGKLMFNEKIPYNSNILAQVTRHNVDVIEKALQVFKELDLIEVMDSGAMYMLDIQNFIGKSSTEADRKRSYRQQIDTEKEKTLNNGQMSGQMSPISPDKSTPEKEKEKEKEIGKEEKISLQIKDLRSRYLDNDLKIIDDYFNILKWTRRSGKIADSVIIKIYKEWEKYPTSKVIYALNVYINNPKHHDKKENYCYGIMRNTTAEEVVSKGGESIGEYGNRIKFDVPKTKTENTERNLDEEISELGLI